MKKDLIAHFEPKSHVSELFRTLRTNIQFMNSNKELRSLLVTSTLPGEGKTWVSSNLAIAFAQADKKVVLIDADMRKCCLHNLFKVAPCPGLSNYLSGVNEKKFESEDLANYIRVTKVPNLYLLPSGNVPPNPSELLITQKMVNLINDLKSEFDLVIIDGTPSKLVTDAVILSRLVDSTIIVTGHNMAKKDDLAKVVRDIKNVGGNIAGVVYNKKPASGKKANETYYYASTTAKWDARKKQEMEAMQKRQSQRARTNEMLNRDRKPDEYLKNVIKEVEEEKKHIGNNTHNPNSANSANAANAWRDVKSSGNSMSTDGSMNHGKPSDHGNSASKSGSMNTENSINHGNSAGLGNVGNAGNIGNAGSSNPAFENGKSPEERATEMLNQFNSYLQKEKENRDKRNF